MAARSIGWIYHICLSIHQRMDGTKPLIRVFETYAQLTPSHEREGVFGEQLAPGAAGDSGKRPSALA